MNHKFSFLNTEILKCNKCSRTKRGKKSMNLYVQFTYHGPSFDGPLYTGFIRRTVSLF